MKHKNTMEWGKNTAKSRYGGNQGPLEGTTAGQKPQDPIDVQGKKYDNDTGNHWSHHGGESRPGFDKKGSRG